MLSLSKSGHIRCFISVAVPSFPLFERPFKLLCLNFGNLAVLVNHKPVLSFLDFSKPVRKQKPGQGSITFYHYTILMLSEVLTSYFLPVSKLFHDAGIPFEA